MTKTHWCLHLIATLTFALLAEAGNNTCSRKYRFAYHNGKYCCANNREKSCSNLGKGCDGSMITNTSTCCDGDEFIKCKKEPCDNMGVCRSKACQALSKKLTDFMDPSVDPCKDMGKFACGNFLKNFVIPDAVPGWFASFSPLHEVIYKRGKKLMLEKPTTPSPFETDKLARDLYESCIDENKINDLGQSPIKKILDDVGEWPAAKGSLWISKGYEWYNAVPKLVSHGFDPNIILKFFTAPDRKNTKSTALYLDQPDLGLDRSALIKGFDHKIVRHYFKMMVDSARAVGATKDTARRDMRKALLFEIELAKISASAAERRDANKLYNKRTIRALRGKPGYPPSMRDHIHKIFDSAGVSGIRVSLDDTIIVQNPKYAEELAKVISRTTKRSIANYVSFRAYQDVMLFLDKTSKNIRHIFRKKFLGVKKPRATWKECLRSAGFNERSRTPIGLSIAATSLYARKYFPKEVRDQADKIICYTSDAFKTLLETIGWMDPKTRDTALKKLKAMDRTVGYRDEILDPNVVNGFFDGLNITDNYFDNMLAINKFWLKYHYGNLRKPIDKSHWSLQAILVMVNAFYNTELNSIGFSTGIMQGGFFDPDLPLEYNFGAFGMVAGHEILHGFDDQGRLTDDQGNLVNWWENATDAKFRERAQCVIDQYGNYVHEQIGMKLNGFNTQGENIADISGLIVAFLAYENYVRDYYPGNSQPPLIVGHNFTPKQWFFIQFGLLWCGKLRDPALVDYITNGEHSPPIMRIRGTLSNNVDFAKAFQCEQGSEMNPGKKCSVW